MEFLINQYLTMVLNMQAKSLETLPRNVHLYTVRQVLYILD